MKLLLDTCAILWMADAPLKLSTTARAALNADSAELFISSISAFEIGLKHRKGKLVLGMTADSWWAQVTRYNRVSVIPVTGEIALASAALPSIHWDPCDRIILATAQEINAAIITSDAHFSMYNVAPVIW